MARPIARLHPARMTDKALRRAARDLAVLLRDPYARPIRQHEQLADDLVQVLDELELRGNELHLFPPAA